MANALTALRVADLALLGSLDVLLEEANVTRAAARLHLSQPALSAQLARLRELTGEPLRAALHELQAALAHGAGFDPERDERTFQILASDNGFVMVGLDLLRRVATRAPRVRLAFQTVPIDSFSHWLDSGAADLVIAADFSIPAGLQTQALLRERYVMAQRKGHPRGLAPPGLDAYCALEHVIVSGDGGGFHGFMDDALARLGRVRRVAASVQQYHLAPLVLEATDYVCALPERFLQRFSDHLDLLPLPVEVAGFGLNAAWHPRHDADAAHAWLRDELFAAAATRCTPKAADPSHDAGERVESPSSSMPVKPDGSIPISS